MIKINNHARGDYSGDSGRSVEAGEDTADALHTLHNITYSNTHDPEYSINKLAKVYIN